MIVNLACPFLILCSVSSSEGGNRTDVLYVLGAGFLMYLLLIAFAAAAVRLLHVKQADSGTMQCMIVFSNNSFMGYPVVQSVLGEEAIFYTSMLHFSFNLFIYTYGAVCLSKGGERQNPKEVVKKMMTPGFALMLLALAVYLLDLRIPPLLRETMQMVGNITTPLSMIVLGSTLAAYPLRQALTDWRCYGVSAIRLLAVPCVTLAVCRLLGVSDFMTGVAVLTNAMPVASMVVMFANQYEGNKELASRGVLISTTLSVLTIPFISMLL